MQKQSISTVHYCCIYAARGILNPNPMLDSLLLTDEKVIVRLLGPNAYESVVARVVGPVDKEGVDSTDHKFSEQFELRQNSLINEAMNNAVIYVESYLPIDAAISYHEENSELPAYVKAPLKLNAERAFKSASVALTFARGSLLSKNYDFIHEQYYVTDSQSSIIAKLNPATISSGGFMAGLDMDEVQVAQSLTSALHYDNELGRIIDIYSESLTPYKNGHLHAFIAAWTALEMFIAKQFKELQASVTIHISGVAAHKDFSSRMLTVMNDKYRLVDKFSALSNYYVNEDADNDIAEFKRIKDIRDKFFHKMEGELKSLPLDETRRLISKYIQIYLEKKLEGFIFERAAKR